mgnify:CR=1 FL=1
MTRHTFLASLASLVLLAASGCAGGTEVDFVRIDGGGHIWPAAFDASQASGQFFASHG